MDKDQQKDLTPEPNGNASKSGQYFFNSNKDMSKLYDDFKLMYDNIGASTSDGMSNIVNWMTNSLNSLSVQSSSSNRNSSSPPNWNDFLQLMGYSSLTSEVEQQSSSGEEVPPECEMTSPEMIEYNGYPCKEYQCETEDGYILTLHRIKHGKSSRHSQDEENNNKPVVFIQHGLIADTASWVANGPDDSLPFILADAGCDVWLGNIRGNSYSRDHRKYNPSTDKQYWNFSWQHMAEFDLGTMVDFALAVTGNKKLYYVGHSQGTLIAFARLSEHKDFNEKIKCFFALAPISELKDLKSPVRSMAPLGKPLQGALDMFGGAEFLAKSPIQKWLSSKLHKLHKKNENNSIDPAGKLVYKGNNFLMYLCGVRPDSYFPDRMPVYFTHTPAGTSLHNIVHFSQLVISGKMQKWDYGTPAKNMDRYGVEKPPLYDVSKITAPIALYVGTEDQLSVLSDVKRVSMNLKTVFKYETLDDFDHLDFLWGRKAPEAVFSDIVRTIDYIESSGQLTFIKPVQNCDTEL